MDEILRAGRYRVEEEIPGGGMSIVFRAFDTRLHCTVVLKEIKPEHLDDPQYRARLAQEARAAAAINHPGIARALDFVDDGKEVFVVYEFVVGHTLRERLDDKGLSKECTTPSSCAAFNASATLMDISRISPVERPLSARRSRSVCPTTNS